jgi:hypothetical protein
MRRRSRRPFLGLAFAGVLLLLMEAGLRLMGVGPAYRVEVLGQWRFAANLQSHPYQGSQDGHSFLVTTNADGLRTGLQRERTSGIRRVALMGDSTVFGWGVDDGQTIADGVQLSNTEILNAAQPGYSTTMMAWLFEEVVQRYQPDITIVFVPMHDTNLVLVSDREVLEGGASMGARVRVGLAQHSRIFEVLRRALFTTASQAWLIPGQQQSKEPRVPRVSDAERSQAVGAIVGLSAGWGGKVMVGYVPFKADLELGGIHKRPTEDWLKNLQGIEVADLRACCKSKGLVLPDDPGHLNAEGNLKVGAALSRLIQ